MSTPIEFGQETVFCDFDSTLVQAESLDELAGIALQGRPDRDVAIRTLGAITQAGVACEIGFDESLDRRLQLFQATRDHVDMVVSTLRGRLSPSVVEHQEWFQENAERIYVISGGFEDIIVPVLEPLGLDEDHIFGNRFVYDDEGNIVDFDRANLLAQPRGKVKQAAALDLPRPRIIYGDGWTDYELRLHGEADLFCAVTETAPLEKAIAVADIVLPKFVPPHMLYELV
jgi:D-3-phosphoglycerate dehydrogenase